MTGLFSAAARGIGEGLEMGAAAALAGMDQELKLTLQTQSERIEAGKTIRFNLDIIRNELIETQRPTEDVDDLLLKVIDAPTKRELRRDLREER